MSNLTKLKSKVKRLIQRV